MADRTATNLAAALDILEAKRKYPRLCPDARAVLLDIPTTYWPKAATVAYFHSYEPPDSNEVQVEVLRRYRNEQKYAGFSVDGRFTNLLKAVRRMVDASVVD